MCRVCTGAKKREINNDRTNDCFKVINDSSNARQHCKTFARAENVAPLLPRPRFVYLRPGSKYTEFSAIYPRPSDKGIITATPTPAHVGHRRTQMPNNSGLIVETLIVHVNFTYPLVGTFDVIIIMSVRST